DANERRSRGRRRRSWRSSAITAHHCGDGGALARGQRRERQALTGAATGGTGSGDDGIDPISLRNGVQVLVKPRTILRVCAGGVDNDRHRKSSNMSVLPVPRHGSWAV